MITTIPTKYDIGQKVYLKKTALDFFEDISLMLKFQIQLLTSIRIHVYPDYTSIYYRIDGKQESIREDKVFSSLEEVEAHCKHDSE